MSNEELMRRFAEGDASAFGELCEQNMGKRQIIGRVAPPLGI